MKIFLLILIFFNWTLTIESQPTKRNQEKSPSSAIASELVKKFMYPKTLCQFCINKQEHSTVRLPAHYATVHNICKYCNQQFNNRKSTLEHFESIDTKHAKKSVLAALNKKSKNNPVAPADDAVQSITASNCSLQLILNPSE